MNEPKIMSEQETQTRILNLAQAQGCLPETKQLIEKYTRLTNACKNQQERQQLATLGMVELYKLLNIQGGLSVNYKEILPPEKDIIKTIKKHNEW